MVFFSGGTDYSAGSITLPFNASVAVICVDVGIVDDSIAENSETFTVRIGTTEPRVTLRPDEGEVTIVDNDRKQTPSFIYIPPVESEYGLSSYKLKIAHNYMTVC